MKRYLGKSVCILFAGKAGVGKSTCADYVWNTLLKEFIILKTPFATGVKDVARTMGWNGIKDTKGRTLLQTIGQAGRAYDENTWVAKAISVAESDVFVPDFVLVDDWRFPNEEVYVKNRKDFIVYTVRVEAPNREILKGTPQYDDISEVALDNSSFDYAINNEGSIEELYKSLDKILTEIINNNLYYTKE